MLASIPIQAPEGGEFYLPTTEEFSLPFPARLMGFPDSFLIPVSDTRAYKQFGNSVAVPVFSAVANFMKPLIHIDDSQNQIHANGIKTA